jgi:hypothetical protein
MNSENRPASVVRTEDTPLIRWEKRILNWFIAVVVGAMFWMAVDFKTDIVVVVGAVANNVKKIDKHEAKLEDHEKRLITVEVFIKK